MVQPLVVIDRKYLYDRTPQQSGLGTTMLTFSNQKLTINLISISIALSFCGVSLIIALFNVLEIETKPIFTAFMLYVPMLTASAIMLMMPFRLGPRQQTPYILLCWVTLSWLLVYGYEDSVLGLTQFNVSEYDAKRLWFFLPNVLLAGFVGIQANRFGSRIVRPLLWNFSLIAGVASALYLANFRFEITATRLLDDSGVILGNIGCIGAIACLAQIATSKLNQEGRKKKIALWIIMLVCLLATVASSTRAAVLGFIFCLFLMPLIFRFRNSLYAWFSISVFLWVCYIFTLPYIDESPILGRLSNIQEDGMDVRLILAKDIVRLIEENPFGKINGYVDSSLGFDYCHNTMLQYIAEAGFIQTIIPFLVLLILLLIKTVKLKETPEYQMVLLVFIGIFLNSVSSGSAYNTLLWFFLFFLAAFNYKDIECSDIVK
jgi:hypothetical protein